MCNLCCSPTHIERRGFLKALAALPLVAALPAIAAEAGIDGYRATFEAVRAEEDGRSLFVIRRFRQAGEHLALTVDPSTLKTEIRPDLKLIPERGFDRSTPYLDALDAATSPPYPTENAGLRRARGAVDGYFLTVDMCPSKKPFESRFFAGLASHGSGPFPVAISISGYWALEHEAEFASLIERQRIGELDVSWVNHSYTHRYVRGLPDRQNFLLMPGTDFEEEVLKTEQLLIAKGLTPSVFFRFPGLVSDAALVIALRRLGLVPLGTDAWLAKLQKPKFGSIVLVHGNGNEPFGISKVKPYLADPSVRWLGLNEALTA